MHDDRDTIQEIFRSASVTGTIDTRFRVARDGKMALVECRASRNSGDDRFIGTLKDVTEQDYVSAITRLEHQLRAGIESFPGIFALWNSRRRLLYWNAGFINAFDFAPTAVRQGAKQQDVQAAITEKTKSKTPSSDHPDTFVVETVNGNVWRTVEQRTADGGFVMIGVQLDSSADGT